jgi:ribosomal protein L22
MIRLIILLAGLTIISSCGNKDKLPTGILKPAKMEAVLWDVIKADVFTTEFIKKDSSKNAAAENLKLQQQIFAIHKISKADFYKSYDYYKSNTEVFKKVMDSMVARAERNKYIKPDSLTAQ